MTNRSQPLGVEMLRSELADWEVFMFGWGGNIRVISE
jgi:hypothetical protein